MDNHVREKTKELETINTKLEKAQQEYEPYKAQDELDRIHELYPNMKENLRIADFCKSTGFTTDATKKLLTGIVLTVTGNLFSPEHKQSFKVQDAKVKIEKEPDNPLKLRLTINGVNILDWFKQKFQEFQDAIGIRRRPEPIKKAGMKL